MTERRMGREEVKDLLPDWISGRLTGARARQVERVVATDEELAAEARFLRRVAAARPEPPPDLTARIEQAVRDDGLLARAGLRAGDTGVGSGIGRTEVGRTGSGRPGARSWPVRTLVAAAALVVLVLGLQRWGVLGTGSAPLDQLALEETPSPWVADDGLVAGAPVLEDLSDEALASLLEELGG